MPHYDGGEITQFITCRLFGTLPKAVLDQWDWELRALPPDRAKVEIRRRAEDFLDASRDGLLSEPHVASLTENAVLHFDGTRYSLHAWVVMPNHVHVLLTPADGHSLGAIVRSWKVFTSLRANRYLGKTGAFWAPDYFDRYMRSMEHYRNTLGYIESNPVRAGLCDDPHSWPYGSAGRRDLWGES